MPGGEDIRLHILRQLLRQGEQADGVGHRRAALAHLAGDLLLRHAVLLHQGLKAARLLHRVEVLALEVLDQTEFHRPAVVRLQHDDGNLFQPGLPRGAPAALA